MIKEQGLTTLRHDIEFDYNYWTAGKCQKWTHRDHQALLI